MMNNQSKFTLFPIFLVLYEIAIYFSNDAYLPALPKISTDLATSHHLVQLTLTLWFLGSATMQLILGPISDRYGRKPVLLIGGVIFALTCILCGLTHSITLLLVFRFIQGATITSMVIPGYAAIHEYFSHEKAIHTLALMGSITVLAPSLGPLFGVLILTVAGWRWIFFLLAFWAFLMLIVLYFKMPETNIKGYEHPIHLKKIAKNYRDIISNKIFMARLFCFCFLFGAMIAWIAAGPFLVISDFHHSSFIFAVMQVMVFGSFILCTRSLKLLMRHLQNTTLIKMGLGLAFAGASFSVLASLLFPQNLWLMVVSMMFIAAGSGLSFPLLNRMAIEASTAPMGTRMAVLSTAMSLLAVLGSGLTSWLYNGSLVSFSMILILFISIACALNGFIYLKKHTS